MQCECLALICNTPCHSVRYICRTGFFNPFSACFYPLVWFSSADMLVVLFAVCFDGVGRGKRCQITWNIWESKWVEESTRRTSGKIRAYSLKNMVIFIEEFLCTNISYLNSAYARETKSGQFLSPFGFFLIVAFLPIEPNTNGREHEMDGEIKRKSKEGSKWGSLCINLNVLSSNISIEKAFPFYLLIVRGGLCSVATHTKWGWLEGGVEFHSFDVTP